MTTAKHKLVLFTSRRDGEWLNLHVAATLAQQHENRIAPRLAHRTAEVRDLMVAVRYRRENSAAVTVDFNQGAPSVSAPLP